MSADDHGGIDSRRYNADLYLHMLRMVSLQYSELSLPVRCQPKLSYATPSGLK